MALPASRQLTYQKFKYLLNNAAALRRLKSTGSRDNLDADEVKKFQKLANEWWDPNGPLKSLLSMNKLRVPFIRDGLLCGERAERLPKKSQGKPLTGLKVNMMVFSAA